MPGSVAGGAGERLLQLQAGNRVGCRVGLTWRANGLQVLGRLSGDKYTHVGSLADAILNNYSHGRSHQIPWKTEKELGKEVRTVTWRSEAELGLEEETLAR